MERRVYATCLGLDTGPPVADLDQGQEVVVGLVAVVASAAAAVAVELVLGRLPLPEVHSIPGIVLQVAAQAVQVVQQWVAAAWAV